MLRVAAKLVMRFAQGWKRKGYVLILLLADYPDETLRGRCRVTNVENAGLRIVCDERNGEPGNLPSTHGDLSKKYGQILSYPSISLSIVLISEAAGSRLYRPIHRR